MKTIQIGYIKLEKNTSIPQSLPEIKLATIRGGPIDTTVMKPFQTRVIPMTQTFGGLTKSIAPTVQEAVLIAYQTLLTDALKIISGAKGNFIMYVDQESDRLDYLLIGKIYKL